MFHVGKIALADADRTCKFLLSHLEPPDFPDPFVDEPPVNGYTFFGLNLP